MKAYKVNLEPYDYELLMQDGKKETKTMHIKYMLPRVLCNSALGGDGRNPHKDFDLMKIGPVAQRIEQCQELFLIVSQDELKLLTDRINVISKQFDYNYFEMFSRVTNAKETIVEEPNG